MTLEHDRKELLSEIFRVKATEFARCFARPTFCTAPAIRAHSVQNARVLDLLVEDGHVVAPTVRLDAARGPIVNLELVGRNRATTFSGLCESHDREIFGPIETAVLDPDNPQHQFLLAYRAVFFEVHATCAAAWQVQTAYLKSAELGINPRDEPSPAGLYAVDRMIVAYDTFMYKTLLDAAYDSRNFGALTHDVIGIDVPRPSVAASALFSLDRATAGPDVARVCLSIMPTQSTQTAVVFSYTEADAAVARRELHAVLSSSGEDQKLALSQRLLNNCQNFALSPSFVASWTAERRAGILDYFIRTLMDDDLERTDPNLSLFWRGA